MGAQHTPGPWMRQEESTSSNYAEQVVSPNRSKKGFAVVARIASGIAYREADARLIAAAPDLLKALEPFAAMLDAEGVVTTPDYSSLKAMMESARAAIAAAKGE